MFTGIVEELGRVKDISKRGSVSLIKIEADRVLDGTNTGDSISVNGVCLTVVKKEGRSLSFEAMPETLKVSNLGSLRISDKVNLERSLKVSDRVHGHFVQGHVDCTGLIRAKALKSQNLSFEISVPVSFIKYIVPKGSVAVDGISLTIVEKRSNSFAVYIIPHTLKNTTLSFKGPSDKVNVEFDMLAKSSIK